jgi:hypothetical protein
MDIMECLHYGENRSKLTYLKEQQIYFEFYKTASSKW